MRVWEYFVEIAGILWRDVGNIVERVYIQCGESLERVLI